MTVQQINQHMNHGMELLFSINLFLKVMRILSLIFLISKKITKKWKLCYNKNNFLGVMVLKEETYLIIDKNGKDITKNVISITNDKVKVQFNESKSYLYKRENIKIFENPTIEDKNLIYTTTVVLTNIKKVLRFDWYYKIFFENNTSKLYTREQLNIENNILKEEGKNLLEYLKELANRLTISEIANEEPSKKEAKNFLKNLYKRINFTKEKSIVKTYIEGKNEKIEFPNIFQIFPFSFNLSQKKALENAFVNRISIIEGPPGTGKTQTILNILANAILKNLTIAVVSNNNSATDNVYEKLEKKGLSSLCAKLGKNKNTKKFVEEQLKIKPYPKDWCLDNQEEERLKQKLLNSYLQIEFYLQEKNEIAKIKQELTALKLEENYFKKSIDSKKLEKIEIPNFKADKLHNYLLFLNRQKNKNTYFSNIVCLKSKVFYQFYKPDLKINSIKDILDKIEEKYYERKKEELENLLKEKESNLENKKLEELFETYTEWSMKLFKNIVYKNYNNKQIYEEKTLKETKEFIKDYPIILSTTYSLRNCVKEDFLFDYLIVDESSQVDLVSAFPALTLAKNIIVVGDGKQLPNIIDSKKIKLFEQIYSKYDLKKYFNYTKNSLLEMTKQIEDVPSVTLKEHYRCHPLIINFCNQKYYNNELIILSKENNKNPIKQYRCVPGNHARKEGNSYYNVRQYSVIKKEVIKNEQIDTYNDSVGIVTPYKPQKKYLIKQFEDTNMAIDTVHGFQGKEKDIIIFSTVANEITKFLDNPNSINVAISRAVKKLYLVTPYEYKSKSNSNIIDFINYIKYNNMEVIDSKIHSIFDLLYKVNERERKRFLETHIPYSKFDSETFMYHLILDILKLDKFKSYRVKDGVYPLRKLVKDRSIFNEEELKFIDSNSHCDFTIYNHFDKKPILIIEVDGGSHRRKEQQRRDRLKDSIIKKLNIEIMRFKTNEDSERERIIEKLEEIGKEEKEV